MGNQRLTTNISTGDVEIITGVGDLLAKNNLSDVDDASTSFDNIKQTATTTAAGVVEEATATEYRAGTASRYADSETAQESVGGFYDHSFIRLTRAGGFTHTEVETGTGGFDTFVGEFVRLQTVASASPSSVAIKINEVRNPIAFPPNDGLTFGVAGEVTQWIAELGGTTANTKIYFLLGPARTANFASDLVERGIGFRIDGTALKGLAHDASSQTVVDLATTAAEGQRIDIRWNGSGNISWYVDGTLAGSTTSGPVTDSGQDTSWGWGINQNSENVVVEFGTYGARLRAR